MNRAIAWAAVGAVIGVAWVAAAGAAYGYREGVETARVPPGAAAAVRSAVIAVGFFWWLGAAAGGLAGGLAALVSGVIRPRPRGPAADPGPAARASRRK